jgi:hypothetical protein
MPASPPTSAAQTERYQHTEITDRSVSVAQDGSMRALRSFALCTLTIVLGASCAPQANQSSVSRKLQGPNPSSSAAVAIGAKEVGERLFYLRGTLVHRLALESKKDITVADLHTRDVFADPHSSWLAYVTPGKNTTGEEDDFVQDPVLHLFNVATKSDVAVGPGLGPIWGPGARVAYLRPVEARTCSDEGCSGRTKVIIRQSSGAHDAVLSRGHWNTLGWLGDRVLVADGDHLDSTLLVDEQGRVTKLPVAPSSVWGGSPDGRWLLTIAGSVAAFVPMANEQASGEPRSLRLKGILAAGAWAPDSTRVVAGVLDRRGFDSRLVALDPSSPYPSRIGSVQPAGTVLWSPSSSSVIVVASRSGGLRAVHCNVDGAAECSSVLRWRRGVALLSVH